MVQDDMKVQAKVYEVDFVLGNEFDMGEDRKSEEPRYMLELVRLEAAVRDVPCVNDERSDEIVFELVVLELRDLLLFRLSLSGFQLLLLLVFEIVEEFD
jgi:hypothetical protein